MTTSLSNVWHAVFLLSLLSNLSIALKIGQNFWE